MTKLALSLLFLTTAGASVHSFSAIPASDLAEAEAIVNVPDALEQDDVAYGIRHLFDERPAKRNRDVVENPKVNYAIRHLFDDDAAEADEIDEDAPEYRAINYAIRHLGQSNANSWKNLIIARLTFSKAATVTAVAAGAAVTALVANGLYKYACSAVQAKKANNNCRQCA